MKIEVTLKPSVDPTSGAISIEHIQTEQIFGREPMLRQLWTEVIQTRDEVVRQALIKLGWTPPPTAKPVPELTVETARRVRAHDPVSSADAAARSILFSGKHAERILAALRGKEMMSTKTIADATGLTVVQVCRRIPELERAGRIRRSQIHTPSGPEDLFLDGYSCWEIA